MSGYFVDFKEEDSGEWKTVNELATPTHYLKVIHSFIVSFYLKVPCFMLTWELVGVAWA